ncbi:hypothetical protein EDD86DRAFT_246422 [Gorgonomyces haynaldii]|nr:hypothetical protein EDD86DRAFT_246422 [Gorgonomyces haynaldii]
MESLRNRLLSKTRETIFKRVGKQDQDNLSLIENTCLEYGIDDKLYLKSVLPTVEMDYIKLKKKQNQSLAFQRVARGLALFKDGQTQRAMEEYRIALEYDPESTDAHVAIGMVLHDKGEYKKAKKQYKRALLLDPQCKKAHLQLEKTQRAIDTIKRDHYALQLGEFVLPEDYTPNAGLAEHRMQYLSSDSEEEHKKKRKKRVH